MGIAIMSSGTASARRTPGVEPLLDDVDQPPLGDDFDLISP